MAPKLDLTPVIAYDFRRGVSSGMDNGELQAALAAYFNCADDVAGELVASMTLQKHDHREILSHQGDSHSQIWLILDGQVQLKIIGLDGQVTLLATHGPGEIFGAFPEDVTAHADVTVYGELSALKISNAEMLALLQKYAALGAGLSTIVGKQFNSVLDRMAARITLTAAGRVYSELLNMAEENDRISPPPVVAAIALTAQTTRETGSRAISALERRGIIRRDPEALEIVSRRMLEELVV